MNKPNSRSSRVRKWISRKIDPVPDKGEAWCINCSLNDGRTLVIQTSQIEYHVSTHTGENAYVRVEAAW